MKILYKIILLGLVFNFGCSNSVLSGTYTSVMSGNLNSAATWGVASIPLGAHNFIISTGHTVTLTAPATVFSLTINSGAVFNNSTFTLTMGVFGGTYYTNNGIHNGTGNIYYNNGGASGMTGTGIINCNIEINGGGPRFELGSSLTINGNIFSPNAGAFSMENYGNIIVNGNISSSPFISGALTNYSGAVIAQTGNTSMYISSWIDNFGTFNISGDLSLGDQYTLYLNESFASTTIEGNLHGGGVGLTFFLQEPNSIVKFGGEVFPFSNDGDLCVSGISLLTGMSTEPNIVEYNGGINQIIKAPSDGAALGGGYLLNTYSDLIVSNSNTKSLSVNTIINGNITIKDNSQLDATATNYNLDLKENWINEGVNTNPFVERNGKVTFSGVVPQSITANLIGGETFYNLDINSLGVTLLNNDINVTNQLGLINGVVTTGNYKTILINTLASALTTFNQNSFVYGTLRRFLTVNTSVYSFPVGKNTGSTNYHRFDLLNNNLTGINYIDISVAPVAEIGLNIDSRISTSQDGTPIVDAREQAEWNVNPDATPTGGNYGVRLFTQNISGLVDNLFTPMKRINNSVDYAEWDTFDATTIKPANGTLGTTVASGYAEKTNFTSFSKFIIGTSATPLPINMLNFSATCKSYGVMLKWSTASEINNDYFTIERSSDAKIFKPIAIINGGGNSNEILSYQYFDNIHNTGVNYYRLRQTDYNGTNKTFEIIPVNCNLKEVVSPIIYPNPAIDFITVSLDLDPNQVIHFLITDLAGNIIQDHEMISTDTGGYLINIQTLKTGLYLLKIQTKEHYYATKFLKN